MSSPTEINDAIPAFGGKSTTYGQLFGRTVTVIHDNFLAKKVITAQPKLNRTKWSLLAIDLNFLMILAGTYARISQEPPYEAMTIEGHAGTKNQERSDSAGNLSLEHLGLPILLKVPVLANSLPCRPSELNQESRGCRE
ncbi:MAG TPA: hypothetical protein VGI46_16605 [Candidatus Acidoferrum sp.]